MTTCHTCQHMPAPPFCKAFRLNQMTQQLGRTDCPRWAGDESATCDRVAEGAGERVRVTVPTVAEGSNPSTLPGEAGGSAAVRAPHPTAIHPDIPAERYHSAEFGIGSSTLIRKAHKSGRHAKAYIDRDTLPPTPAMEFGTALHAAVLEPSVFAATYAVAPEKWKRNTKAGKAAHAEWAAEHPGKSLITYDDGQRLDGMRESLMSEPAIRQHLEALGRVELSLTWTDKATGIRCKARPDKWIESTGVMGDLKTARDATPSGFRRSCGTLMYDVQEAHYRAGAKENGLEIRRALGFPFIVVESVKPYPCGMYTLDSASIELAEKVREAAMVRLARWLDTDTWPGYTTEEPDGIKVLGLPQWRFFEMEESDEGWEVTIS